jgi:hypothetical protein
LTRSAVPPRPPALAHGRPERGRWEANFHRRQSSITVVPPGKSRLTKARQHGHHQSRNASAEMAYNPSIRYVRPKVSERLRRSAGDRGLSRKARHARVRRVLCSEQDRSLSTAPSRPAFGDAAQDVMRAHPPWGPELWPGHRAWWDRPNGCLPAPALLTAPAHRPSPILRRKSRSGWSVCASAHSPKVLLASQKLPKSWESQFANSRGAWISHRSVDP